MAVITRETDYALRALLALAGADEFVAVTVLAQQQGVPVVFLRKIMQRLHRAGVVESRQGPFGGYRLAVPADAVSLLDVVEAVQGPLVMNECFHAPDLCDRAPDCPVRRCLQELQSLLQERLSALTVGGVAGGACGRAPCPKAGASALADEPKER
ncbi:MAG: Rrf2 family transcriptional regulator [Candidatus Brocadiaceae bacterium]|nr:Rrf2 family transcriptional regulator [Candidatus Brocadiaceae bacterium]